MAYRLRPGASPEKEVIRCVRRVIDEAAEKLAKGSDVAKAIHLARTACKKARAALRLLEGSATDFYKRENCRFRDWAQALSPLRDAEILVKCLSNLLRSSGDSDSRRFACFRQLAQTHRRAVIADGPSVSRELKRFTGRIRKASHRLDRMRLDEISSKSLLKGFVASYRRARRAGRKACAHQTSTTFHEWRKRVKTHGYQCQLFSRDFWPAMMKTRGPQLTKLGNLLGDHHDFVLLRQFVCDRGQHDKNGAGRGILLDLIDARLHSLQIAAEQLRRRLFSEKPRIFKRRLRPGWKRAEAKA